MRSDETSYPEPTGIRFGTDWNKVRYVPFWCRSSVTTNIDPVGLADVAIPSRTSRLAEGRSQVSTWSLSIARFTALSAIRRRAEAAMDDTAMELLKDSADTPEEAVLKEDRSAQVRHCLAQMSREHREVIDLVYYHEKSIEEVADIIRAPKNTVKTRIFYARKRLAQLLSHHCDFNYLAVCEGCGQKVMFN
jgi:RNA polymerase sigma factor (sigma-70 family)